MGRLITELLRPYRGWLAIILLATAVETAMSLAAPWPLKIVLDQVISGEQPPGWIGHIARLLPGEGVLRLAAFAAIATVLIAALEATASFVDNYYTESVGQRVANDLRIRMYNHLEHLPLAYYDTHETGTLLSTITDDIATIQGFASSSTLGIFVDLLTITGILVLMFWLRWDFALVAVGVAPFLLLFVTRFRKAVKKATREVRRRESELVGVVQQGLESIRVVNAFGRQELEEAHLSEASGAAVRAALKARMVKSLLPPVVVVTVSLCTAFVLYRGASLVLASAMTAGSLTVFLSYLHKFFKPVQDLAKMTSTIAQAAVAVERVGGILDIDLSVPERPGARDPGKLAGKIEFVHVAFGYDPAKPVLKDVSFSIEAGEFVGIVGSTGTGKSTVVGLIARFYDPTAGRILIDGVDLCDFKLQGLRPIVSCTRNRLFRKGRRTIALRAAFGVGGIVGPRALNAHGLSADGYDTLVGGGLALSGSEQRIGTLVRGFRLTLTSHRRASTPESARGGRGARAGEGAGGDPYRASPSTVRDADKIVVLKDGVVAEQGTHDELLALDGVYAELYRIQAGLSSAAGRRPVARGAGA
jgi:subfamily B ATP-binding cassette protein MsbA